MTYSIPDLLLLYLRRERDNTVAYEIPMWSERFVRHHMLVLETILELLQTSNVVGSKTEASALSMLRYDSLSQFSSATSHS